MMQNFLKYSRKLVNAKDPVCIVLGNESCDLDSAVCAISLAYFYQTGSKPTVNTIKYLPILNIPRRDYPLKTEVKYLFDANKIKEEVLTFRDELNDEFLKNNSFILVDHHVSPWLNRSIAIYDHRPQDPAAVIPDNCILHLSLVGSCATLVAEEFINSKMLGETERDILDLMRSAIILDTVNFSEAAGRATSKDSKICTALEKALNKFSFIQARDAVFEALVKARGNVSSLSAFQLLRKDFKILTSAKNEDMKVGLPGLPLQVQQFIEKPNASDAIIEFAKEFKCSVVLLLGMYIHPADNNVHRDLGIINISNPSLCESIKQSLLSTSGTELSAEHFKDCNFMNGSFYKQHNIKVTRKHILPIVKSVLDK